MTLFMDPTFVIKLSFLVALKKFTEPGGIY